MIGDVVLSRPAPSAGGALPVTPPTAVAATPAPTRQQMAALASPLLQPPPPGDPRLPSVGGGAPIASFSRSNQGWTATFSLPAPALALSYRIGRD